jgi:hypothetical protein
VFGIIVGAGAVVERVVVCGLLVAVMVRSVPLGRKKSRAPTTKMIEATAMNELQPDSVSVIGTFVWSGLFRRDSSYGVICGKFGSYVMDFPPVEAGTSVQ